MSAILLLDHPGRNRIMLPVLLVAFLVEMRRELDPVPDAREKTSRFSACAKRMTTARSQVRMPPSAAKEQLLAAAGPLA
jgi:hypothetical protein